MRDLDISAEDLKLFIKQKGERAVYTLTLLNKLYDWIANVIETQPGKDILSDDLRRHEELLIKQYAGELTDAENGEYAYLKKRIPLVAQKISDYKKLQKKVVSKGERDG